MEEYGFNKDLDSYELAWANNQGIVFEECQDLGADAVDYITKFMLSEVAENIDKRVYPYSCAGAAPIKRTAYQKNQPIKPYSDNNHINEDTLYWIGYIYRYWQNLLGTSSKEIIKIVPVEKAMAFYPACHSMGNKEAIARMINMVDS
ncbi:MAG: hypothetical protein FWH05_03540 [Oscillospiraceae bacterium]|nr:hypothetical protein [Oscillospiraceae bacterium]